MAEMTLEEAFAAATVDVQAGMVDDVFVIDATNRKIIVPDSESIFGVETDKDAERKYFRCPRIVGDNIDLYAHKIYVVYVTAKDVKGTFLPDIVNDKYWCDDVAVDGDCITFSWKLSDNVMLKAGIIAFKILAVTTEDGKEKTRWNTAPAYGTVLMTVPDGDDITEIYPDIVTQLLERMDAVEEIATEEAIQGYVNKYLEEHEGPAGEDGGYYTPSVDTEGNLTWTASKTGMPTIAGANIKGPKGDAGDPGTTPQRGADYWTDADKAEIKSYVDDAILGGAW